MAKNLSKNADGGGNISSGRLSAEELRDNFSDLHPPLDKHQSFVEADRCYFCHDAPCTIACPTSIDIPQFIRQIATGNPVGSAATILEQNIMGGMCARVCPTETLCEEACVRNLAEEKPVQIGLLQRYATDHVFAEQRQLFEREAATDKRVAVVGAGPGGLSCAHGLARRGHDVTVFEAREKPGGLNEYGIAAYKTVDNFAQREVNFILSLGGIDIKYGQELGRDMELGELREKFDAVFLGLGKSAVQSLGLDHEDTAGSMDAVDYIAQLRQSNDLGKLPVGRRVVVIGGGMTAIDIATQSKGLGAEDVTIVYRRGKAEMNASLFEQDLAQKRGVRIKHNARPVKLIEQGGRLIQVEFEYTQKDESGHLSGTGETYRLDADMVFKAIGQKFVPLTGADDLPAMDQGCLQVDDARRTSLPDVWAGGDCVAGGENLTVVAVEDGKIAAAAIHEFLSRSA